MSSLPRFLSRTELEPPPGSVVMLEGVSGTVFQRLFSTDLWHSTTKGLSQPFTWDEVLAKTDRPGARSIILLHVAPLNDAEEDRMLSELLVNSSTPTGATLQHALDAVEQLRANTLHGATYLAEAVNALREYRRLHA